MLIHGDADPLIPVQQSETIIQRLHKARVPSQLVIREGRSHAWNGWESEAALIASWFTRQLSPIGK